jgi:hypothetical protein
LLRGACVQQEGSVMLQCAIKKADDDAETKAAGRSWDARCDTAQDIPNALHCSTGISNNATSLSGHHADAKAFTASNNNS